MNYGQDAELRLVSMNAGMSNELPGYRFPVYYNKSLRRLQHDQTCGNPELKEAEFYSIASHIWRLKFRHLAVVVEY